MYKVFEEAPKRRENMKKLLCPKLLTTLYNFVRTVGLKMKLLRKGLLRYGREW